MLRHAWLAVCLCCCGLWATPVSAQDTTADTAAPKGPVAIAVAEIPARADQDERYAEETSLQATSTGAIVQLTTRLDAIDRSVDEKARLYRGKDLLALPVLRLESLERHWKFDARRFASWREDKRLASAPYVQGAAELARRRADWEATQRSSVAADMPAALSTRVDALVLRLKAAEQALSVPLARQIALGSRANAIDARIQAGLRAVGAAIEYIDRRLLRLDSPPLWRARSAGTDADGLSTLRTGVDVEVRFMKDYVTAETGNQRRLTAFQLLLLPLLVWLGLQHRRTMGADAQASASARVLRRPISTWLLLAMMGVLVFERDAPLLVHQVAMLIALVPVLRLLPPESSRLLGAWPYVITTLYLLERLAFLFVANSFLYRSYCLGLTVLALLAAVWLLWQARRRQDAVPAGRVRRALHLAAWISVVMLVVSALVNILGNLSLAEMLTSGVIDSGYMALLLHAGVTVSLALVHLLFARRDKASAWTLRTRAAPVLKVLTRLVTLAAMVGWVVFAMNRFRVFRPTYAFMEGVLTHTFEFGELSISLGNIVVFGVSVFIAFWAANLVRSLLQDEVLTRMSLPRGVGNSVASLTYYALLLLGVLVALSAAGFKVSQLAFVFGALGVGIGFGLQNVVNNFVSGLILMFERPIQPGDVVEITGTSGRVREIGMRATTIKTFDGADVIVPNGTLLSEKVTNWTLLDPNRRLDVDVGVAYGSDAAQVIGLLEEATRATPSVVTHPAPVVLFTGLGASSLNFGIRAWTHDFDNWTNIRSDLIARIYAALMKAGIEIPFPQQDLHLRSISDDVAARLARGEER